MQIQDAGTAFRWHPDRSVQVNGITVVPGSQEITNENRVGSFRDLYGKYVREAPLASIRPGFQAINREPRARPHSVVNEHYSDTGDEVESSMSCQPRPNTPRVVNENDRESSPDVPLASIRPYVQPINHEPEPNQSSLMSKNRTEKVQKVDASINRDVEMIDHEHDVNPRRAVNESLAMRKSGEQTSLSKSKLTSVEAVSDVPKPTGPTPTQVDKLDLSSVNQEPRVNSAGVVEVSLKKGDSQDN
jgi:hypothetical protein